MRSYLLSPKTAIKSMARLFYVRSAILLSALILLLLASGPVGAERPMPKPGPQVLLNDFANVIPPDYKQKILAVTRELLQKTGTPLVVVTMPDIGGAEYNDYANRLYSLWGIGKAGEDKGVLIFVTVKERKMRIETGYGVEGILPDGLAGEIRDRYMTPFLKQDKYGQGLLNGTLAVAQVIAKHAGVQLTGQMPIQMPEKRRRSGLSLFPLLLIVFVFMDVTRRRGGAWARGLDALASVEVPPVVAAASAVLGEA